MESRERREQGGRADRMKIRVKRRVGQEWK